MSIPASMPTSKDALVIGGAAFAILLLTYFYMHDARATATDAKLAEFLAGQVICRNSPSTLPAGVTHR